MTDVVSTALVEGQKIRHVQLTTSIDQIQAGQVTMLNTETSNVPLRTHRDVHKEAPRTVTETN